MLLFVCLLCVAMAACSKPEAVTQRLRRELDRRRVLMGECPRIEADYKGFYARRSTSFLDEHCAEKERPKPSSSILCEMFVIFLMILMVNLLLCVVFPIRNVDEFFFF